MRRSVSPPRPTATLLDRRHLATVGGGEEAPTQQPPAPGGPRANLLIPMVSSLSQLH